MKRLTVKQPLKRTARMSPWFRATDQGDELGFARAANDRKPERRYKIERPRSTAALGRDRRSHLNPGPV